MTDRLFPDLSPVELQSSWHLDLEAAQEAIALNVSDCRSTAAFLRALGLGCKFLVLSLARPPCTSFCTCWLKSHQGRVWPFKLLSQNPHLPVGSEDWRYCAGRGAVSRNHTTSLSESWRACWSTRLLILLTLLMPGFLRAAGFRCHIWMLQAWKCDLGTALGRLIQKSETWLHEKFADVDLRIVKFVCVECVLCVSWHQGFWSVCRQRKPIPGMYRAKRSKAHTLTKHFFSIC